MNTLAIEALRQEEAKGCLMRLSRVPRPIVTQTLPEDKDRIIGLPQEV